MAPADLRDTVRAYINTADEKLLKMMKALAESYTDAEQDLILTEDQYQEIDRRREAHFKGESDSFSWEQVRQNARKAKD